MSQTLLDKATHNYNIAVVIAQTMDGDEAYLNYVGYHLQQSVELALKFQLEECGVQYPKTHDIDQLIRISRENELNLYIPEYIEEHAEMLSLWESRTRYVLDYQLEANKVSNTMNSVGEYIAWLQERELVKEEELEIDEYIDER